MANQNLSPRRWRQLRNLTMAGAATMLGISGKNAARTWQRYETGERVPPIGLLLRMEMISDGQVTTASWAQVRLAYVGRQTEGVAT